MELALREAANELAGRSGGQGCKICRRPDVEDIHALMASGYPTSLVPTQFNREFSRKTLHAHVTQCLHKSHSVLRADKAKDLALNLDGRLAILMDKAEQALAAAEAVLLVDGDLCFDPRAWEVTVVYLDHNDKNERTHEPKLKTGKLSKLLAMCGEAGYEPQHSYIKAEDARKTYRECIASIADLIDRIAKITGHYKKVDVEADQLDYIKGQITKAAHTFGTDYARELEIFLEQHGDTLAPTLRGMLLKESQSLIAPLAAGGREVKSLPPSPVDSVGPSEGNRATLVPATEPEP